MKAAGGTPAIVRWTLGLERATALDRPVQAIEPSVRRAFGSGSRGAALRGDWLGHALHPLLTDVVIGTWTSASVLDLAGGRDASGAAQRLVGVGLLAFGPTAWTGWAQWVEAAPRDQRVGLVHAVTNGVAAGAYGASWWARRKGSHGTGAALALGGMAISGVGAYLGGHLVAVRKLATGHPGFDDATPVGTSP